jgi:hypothetical protein
VPFDVHVPEPVLELPVNTTLALLAHTVWAGPAATVGIPENTSSNVLVTGKHPPLFCDVIVNVTEPAVVSAVLGL